jgi:hypothetical protein
VKKDSTAAVITLALLVVAFMVGICVSISNIRFFPGAVPPRFAGEPPPPPDDHTVDTVLAAGGTLVGPLIGIFVAIGIGRAGIAVLFGFLLVLGIAFSSLWLPKRTTDHAPPAPTTGLYRPCAEYSGGDNECPGG